MSIDHCIYLLAFKYAGITV